MGEEYRGHYMEAVRRWFRQQDDRVQGRPVEGRARGATTNPLPLVGRVSDTRTVVRGKGIGGGQT